MPRKTDRRHQQGEESRRRILEATLQIASQRGYEGTTVTTVTEATGLPASSVYWHFKNKDELLAAVIEYSYRQFSSLNSPVVTDDSNAPSLHRQALAQLRQIMKRLTEQPEFWRLGLMLVLERRIVEPAARSRYLQLRAESLARGADLWRQMLPAEALAMDPTIADHLSRLTLTAMDGLFLAQQAQDEWDYDAMLELISVGLAAVAQRLLDEAEAGRD